MKDDRVFRLAKPKAKGMLRIIFSRFLIFLLLLALQVLLVVRLYNWLNGVIPHFSAVRTLFTFAMVVYLFNTSMDSTAKLTWMFLISVTPIPGTMLLLFTRANAGHRRITKRVSELIEETKDAIPQPEAPIRELSRDGSGTDDLSKYLKRSGCFPVFEGTSVTYFPSGEEKFEAVLRELRAAEKYIFLEYFIIEEGYMWGEVLKILTEKARRGVDVRVLYDGMCEVNTLPVNYRSLLFRLGIKAKSFSPIRPIASSHYNYRDHRKILVVDGRVAFNGGVNFADEYINRKKRFGHWKDAAVMLRGEAVKSFTLMFLQMWNIDEREPDFSPEFLESPPEPEAEGYVMPYGDCPLDSDKVGEMVYMDILARATDYVHIMTPYLILDGELETAIKYAAQRGVDVKIILPGVPDKKIAYALAKSHYRSLTGAGVKIFEYTPGFVHAKVAVCDGKKAVVGTINLDYRSLYHHFECATYMYKTPCIADAEQDFQNTLAKCRQVTAETIKKERLFYKVMGSLMKFVAPLM